MNRTDKIIIYIKMFIVGIFTRQNYLDFLRSQNTNIRYPDYQRMSFIFLIEYFLDGIQN